MGVYTTDNLKPSLQCSKAAGKEMSILGMINRNFKCIYTEDFQILYKLYVRPHLEYCESVIALRGSRGGQMQGWSGA